ncbi:unnamed protein product, partial [Musa acuminata subsp. burmannicoides]
GSRRPRSVRLQVRSHGGGTRGRLPRQLDRRHTLLAALSPSPTSTAPSRGIFSAAIGRRVIFAERQPKASGCSRVDRTAGTGSWLLNRRQEPVKSIVDGREIVVGRRSYLSFKDGRRKNSGWVMYEYEMCSSTFETRVLCHVKKSSYQPISGGKFMKSSDLSPPPTAVVQQLLLAPVVTTLESHLSSIDSVAPNEAGVPAATPSSTDVGGGDVGITAEELEAFDLGKTAEELEAFLASPSSSVDLGGDQHCTDDPFF